MLFPKMDFVCWFQVPYKIKDVELDYDNYNQVPESPIGRDEEPHLCMIPKKYRKVRHAGVHSDFYIAGWLLSHQSKLAVGAQECILLKINVLNCLIKMSLCCIRSQLSTPNLD